MSSRLMPPNGGLERWRVDDVVGISAPTSRSKTSMSANCLKRTPLPSITGLPASGADVAESEHGGAVGDDGDQVAARRVGIDQRSSLISRQGSATPGE